eukprot:TRINITY_DN2398_c0_g1_i1.p1 TRINITY_DN2398_c0_g1~~TRINITY_DN2398_c0_g1_i1.p1  ORF type:complete len:274 (+),score=99.72 TRINITY_DN2398_c0_g1_i1:105-926(+)
MSDFFENFRRKLEQLQHEHESFLRISTSKKSQSSSVHSSSPSRSPVADIVSPKVTTRTTKTTKTGVDVETGGRIREGRDPLSMDDLVPKRRTVDDDDIDDDVDPDQREREEWMGMRTSETKAAAHTPGSKRGGDTSLDHSRDGGRAAEVVVDPQQMVGDMKEGPIVRDPEISKQIDDLKDFVKRTRKNLDTPVKQFHRTLRGTYRTEELDQAGGDLKKKPTADLQKDVTEVKHLLHQVLERMQSLEFEVSRLGTILSKERGHEIDDDDEEENV